MRMAINNIGLAVLKFHPCVHRMPSCMGDIDWFICMCAFISHEGVLTCGQIMFFSNYLPSHGSIFATVRMTISERISTTNWYTHDEFGFTACRQFIMYSL